MVISAAKSRFFVNSEYKKINAVLLCRPSVEIAKIDGPESALHLKKIDYCALNKEFQSIIRLYKKLKINTYFISPPHVGRSKRLCLYNMMYTRDLLFMAAGGVVIAKMASYVRREETSFVEEVVKNIGIPITKKISGESTLEGADALWINEKLVMVGVGKRTNRAGFLQLKEALKKKGVNCISVPAPEGSLHLLGALQLVDSNLALLRHKIASSEITDVLKRNKFDIINIPEIREVRQMQAMNIVVAGPRKIIMPAYCPRVRRIYERRKLEIAAQVDVRQLVNGAGGLACATAVISRAA